VVLPTEGLIELVIDMENISLTEKKKKNPQGYSIFRTVFVIEGV
jgi:hypothetical protein